MTEHQQPPDPVEWDEEVRIEVTVRIRVRSNTRFEGLQGRNARGMAEAALWSGRNRSDNLDGYADFTGDIDIVQIDDAL